MVYVLPLDGMYERHRCPIVRSGCISAYLYVISTSRDHNVPFFAQESKVVCVVPLLIVTCVKMTFNL